MVDSLWAIIICVILTELLRLFSNESSVYLSKADVASSKISIFGFLIIALAIATLCFCPPDKRLPLEPTDLFQLSYSFFDWLSSPLTSAGFCIPKLPFSMKS